MKILKAIGGVFVKIWRWIKNTAWVQPLLIVGAIFGVIFSIPAITRGIQNAINNSNSAETFYNSYKKSMEGGSTSSADTLFNNYKKYSIQNSDGTKVDEIPVEERKYFLLITASGNADANNWKTGFEVLRDNWNQHFERLEGDKSEFRLYTIFTSETTNQTTVKDSAFSQFLGRNCEVFENAASDIMKTNYYIKNKIDATKLGKLGDCNPTDFPTPTLLLIDWYHPLNNKGVTELTFTVTGDNEWARASFLNDMWNHKGDFSEK